MIWRFRTESTVYCVDTVQTTSTDEVLTTAAIGGGIGAEYTTHRHIPHSTRNFAIRLELDLQLEGIGHRAHVWLDDNVGHRDIRYRRHIVLLLAFSASAALAFVSRHAGYNAATWVTPTGCLTRKRATTRQLIASAGVNGELPRQRQPATTLEPISQCAWTAWWCLMGVVKHHHISNQNAKVREPVELSERRAGGVSQAYVVVRTVQLACVNFKKPWLKKVRDLWCMPRRILVLTKVRATRGKGIIRVGKLGCHERHGFARVCS